MNDTAPRKLRPEVATAVENLLDSFEFMPKEREAAVGIARDLVELGVWLGLEAAAEELSFHSDGEEWEREGPFGKRCWWAVRLIEGRIHGE